MKSKTSAAEKPVQRYSISDLSAFLANPVVPLRTGGGVAASLTKTELRSLPHDGPGSCQVAGHPIELTLRSGPFSDGRSFFDPDAPETDTPPLGATVLPARLELLRLADFRASRDDDVPAAVEDSGQPLPDAPKSLPLAIFLPWQQQWRLDGFSRGNLLSSITLTPGEETTITVSSWERRSKALEQSSETEIEQAVDHTQTTRDTEDVAREVTSRHDFQLSLGERG